MDGNGYEYDVTFSFAGEDRFYVESVAGHLERAGAHVFYDGFEQVDLWGKDLYAHLDEVYRRRARYCVMFISRHYRDKLWTNHERQSAQTRAFEASQEYILPARFDDTEIPGVRPTVGYVDLKQYTPEAFAKFILQKLSRKANALTEASGPSFRTPRIARRNFNPYEEGERFIEHVAVGFQTRCAGLADRGVSFSRLQREGRTCLRVVLDGATRYALDVWTGGMSRDSSLCFSSTRGEPYRSGGMNAWGDIVWSTAEDRPVLKLLNMSLIGRMGQNLELGHEQLLDELWEDACKSMEGTGR